MPHLKLALPNTRRTRARFKSDPYKSLPTQAKWRTLKRFVVRGQTYDEKTKGQKIVTLFDQLGLVWQAEEVLEAGSGSVITGSLGITSSPGRWRRRSNSSKTAHPRIRDGDSQRRVTSEGRNI